MPLKVRSMVGLIPLFAVETVSRRTSRSLPRFRSRLLWFVQNRPDLSESVAKMNQVGAGKPPDHEPGPARAPAARAQGDARRDGFLSPYGIRALSHYHLRHP